MMCYLHYISASRRLHEAEKTVTMLSTNKYSERDVPQMVLAQRDFIKKEKEYFGDECVKWNFILLAKPLSYEFRVVEHVDKGQIVKVGLQYQVWEHDNYGIGNVRQHWTDVKRVQKDVATGEITEL